MPGEGIIESEAEEEVVKEQRNTHKDCDSLSCCNIRDKPQKLIGSGSNSATSSSMSTTLSQKSLSLKPPFEFIGSSMEGMYLLF